MKLVIAEKPSVARAIYPVLGATEKKKGYNEGNGYIVSWCFGHLVGLSAPNDYGDVWSGKWDFSQLPMIPVKWRLKVLDESKEQFEVLKKLLNRTDITEVICATDADREGECIFRYVYRLTGCKKPVKRLWISSLEESSVKNGFATLKDSSYYDNLFAAGFCRAKADWLIGMNGTRLFSVRHNARLNTGRVQTPTLAMIVKRDTEIKNFVKQKYFTVELDCGGFTAVSERFEKELEAKVLAKMCNGKSAVVSDIKTEEKTVNPPKLYDLTTLQREANKLFGYTAKQTLDFTQSLYEAKLVTYPRTDSQYISDDMEQTANDVICLAAKIYGYGNSAVYNVKRCINNEKVTGHHAIIPTVKIQSANISELKQGEQNILALVAAKLLCAAGMPYKYKAVNVIVDCENHDFTATGKVVIESGWKETYDKMRSILPVADSKAKQETTLPKMSKGNTFTNVKAVSAEHWTAPPKPYTEDTLLSAMEHAGQENYDENTEKKGLGTPATRAAIIEALVKHEYAERKGKQITSTQKGVSLIAAVPSEMKSAELTAEWETTLQNIERGKADKDEFMNGIVRFTKELCEKYGSADNSLSFSNTLGKCPKCGSEILHGKFGYYCKGRCGMNVAKVYGKELTQNQLSRLLSGKETSYTVSNRKTTVLPEIVENTYNGKSTYQWKTK